MQGECGEGLDSLFVNRNLGIIFLFCQRSLAFGSSDLVVVYMLGNPSAGPGRFSSAILGEVFQSTCYGNGSRNGATIALNAEQCLVLT